MKCPLKITKMYKNSDGALCCGTEDNYQSTIAKIETDFGDCDLRTCMAYNMYTGKCRMMDSYRRGTGNES